MDGIAFSSQAWRAGQRRFRVAGTQAAGQPALQLPAATDCLEAMTGAVLPTGCDCVVPVERLQVADGCATVDDDLAVAPFLNVHTRGLDARAGDLLLAPGTRLHAPELAVLASAGLARADVSTEPRIVICATGDELVAPGLPIADWQVRRSNSYALRGALNLRGCQLVAEDHLPDDHGVLAERLARHLATHDVLVLTGGVSMGRFDHVPSVLRQLGVTEVFHKVAQRPGKPVWFGVGPTGQTVFGLPGNPVSALVCLLRYVVPALAAMLGAPTRVVEHLPLACGIQCETVARIFPAGAGRIQYEPGPDGHAATHARVRGFRLAARHRWLRGVAARAARIRGRPSRSVLSLVTPDG